MISVFWSFLETKIQHFGNACIVFTRGDETDICGSEYRKRKMFLKIRCGLACVVSDLLMLFCIIMTHT